MFALQMRTKNLPRPELNHSGEFFKRMQGTSYSYSTLVAISQNYTLEKIICGDILRIISPGDGKWVRVSLAKPCLLGVAFFQFKS